MYSSGCCCVALGNSLSFALHWFAVGHPLRGGTFDRRHQGRRGYSRVSRSQLGGSRDTSGLCPLTLVPLRGTEHGIPSLREWVAAVALIQRPIAASLRRETAVFVPFVSKKGKVFLVQVRLLAIGIRCMHTSLDDS